MFYKLIEFLRFLKRIVVGSPGSKELDSVEQGEAELRAKKILRKAQEREQRAVQLEKEVKRRWEKYKQEKASFEARVAGVVDPGEEGEPPSGPGEEPPRPGPGIEDYEGEEAHAEDHQEGIDSASTRQAQDAQGSSTGKIDPAPPGLEEETVPVAGPGKTEVIIGLDFGTSSCKVVFRTPFEAGEPAYPVKFDTADECPLLLPTKLYRGANGELSLKPIKGCEFIDGLKVSLMDRPGEENVKTNTAGFLALVLRDSAAWWRKEYAGEYRNTAGFNWSLNIGIPSSGSDDGDMRTAFQQVANAAGKLWMDVENGVEMITHDSACNALDRVGEDDPGEPLNREDDVEFGKIFPSLREEVVAEVQGYCRSDAARKGLHVMMDVGASTLDICGFQLGEKKGAEGNGYGGTEGFNALLATLVERLGAEVKKENTEAGVIDEEFAKDCRRVLDRAMSKVEKKAPNEPAFKRGEPLPVFLCGGGGLDPFYTEVIERVNKGLREKKLASFGGLDTRRIPPHETIRWPEGVDEAHAKKHYYPRIAVAFGLAFSEDDIGDIFPPSSTKDLPTPDVLPGKNPIGPEQV